MRRDTNWQYVALLILLVVVVTIFNSCQSDIEYNNGICKSCGGSFSYSTAVGHKYNTRYIYFCDKCGRAIEVDKKY